MKTGSSLKKVNSLRGETYIYGVEPYRWTFCTEIAEENAPTIGNFLWSNLIDNKKQIGIRLGTNINPERKSKA